MIHKAKVKKAYSKLLHREHSNEKDTKQDASPEALHPHHLPQDLGRFAPENPEDDLMDQVTRKDRPSRSTPKQAPKKKLPYFKVPPAKEAKSQTPKRTREEAIAQREERHALWTKKSPSERGRARGQPDLGARMQVMLDKIQRET